MESDRASLTPRLEAEGPTVSPTATVTATTASVSVLRRP
jgi:hypothetical protein